MIKNAENTSDIEEFKAADSYGKQVQALQKLKPGLHNSTSK
jgi:hypothetical protein